MDLFQTNLLTLEALDRELAARVRRTRPGEELELFEARSGAASARLRRSDGSSITLHSRFDPEEEAEGFVAGCGTDKITTYIVLGFGLGHHVKRLLAQARRESEIIVIERDTGLFRAALESVDLREVFASRRVFPVVGMSPPEIFKALTPHVVKMFLDSTYLVHRPSSQCYPDYYTEVHSALSDFLTYGMQNVITTVSVDFLSKYNTLMNLPYYAAAPGPARWRGAYEGCPAIIVSAGPSLHRNVELLRKARGRAVIIAVSTVLKPLLARGIEPDFAVVLDYHPISKKYFEDSPGGENVHLVADAKASWEAVEAHPGPVAVAHNDALHHIIDDPPFHKGAIPAGTTVAHSAFYFAEYIGADPIIFVGQDLAHPDGVTHFPGTAVHDVWAAQANRFESLERREWESILRMRNTLQKVPDIRGNDVYTDGQMFSYLRQFEMNFYNSPARVIDATEGGARKKYTEVMTLAEALEKFATRELPAEPPPAGHETPDLAAPEEMEAIRRSLSDRLESLTRVRVFYDETLSILHKIDDFWPDQEKIGPHLEEIERIRREVRSYDRVNSLVRDISQAVELRKVQADRKIRSDRLEGLDKQKAQLERDLEYVGGLRERVDDLEKIFREALERFESFPFEKIESAPQGAGAPT